MFKPRFTYTHRIVNYIAKIASARQAISDAKIIPVYADRLKQDALIKSSHYSTSIEANPLKLDEVKTLIMDEKRATTKAEQEVLNYFNTLNHLDIYADKGITRKALLSLHGDLTKDLLRDPEYEGRFRDTDVIIGNIHARKINHIAPDAEEVSCLVDELLDWLNNGTAEMYPIIVAGILHYELVRIHPFIDGNGRTSRLMTNLVLSASGFDVDGYLTLDEYYNQDRQSYVEALNSADKSRDLTAWLEYFCQAVAYSVDNVKREVLILAQKTLKYEHTTVLTANEISVLTFLEENVHIRNRDVQKMLDISAQASYKILKKLMDINLIRSLGRGRSTEYELK